MKQWLTTLLVKLEEVLPPTPGAHHAITAASYGSDETGWEDQLALHLMIPNGRVTVFLEEDDFAKTSESVVTEVVQMLSRINHG